MKAGGIPLGERPVGWRRMVSARLRSTISLVGKGRRLTLLLLMAERVAVGFCDLLLAGSMYLFLLLQSAAPAHHGWWTPKSTLSAAFVTASLILVRVLLDLVSTRSVVGYIQQIYTDILLRLTHGYNGMQWVRFARREIAGSFLTMQCIRHVRLRISTILASKSWPVLSLSRA
jgi:hypothetical protein